ncbi:MAG: hypothetical protein KIT84_08860 [Labilithrix sp.]|nr:hypothetical protein [Labilithrix sp.]MCW5811109.1 hypothetical protein [Labilithrix sp.]
MAEFVFLYRGGDPSWAKTPEQTQQAMQKWLAWMKDLEAKGALKNMGLPLHPSGKVLRGKDRSVVDGPFAEAKDVIGGFSIVEAKDIDHAVELSRGCPLLEGGGDVEVRPAMSM